jgi:hypothetical protein
LIFAAAILKATTMRSSRRLSAFLAALAMAGCLGCGRRDSVNPDKLSASGVAILRGATRVEVFRVGPEKVQGPADRTLGGYPILSTGSEQNQAFGQRLTKILLSGNVTQNAKKCGFEPGVGFRLWDGDQSVVVLICFKCNVLWAFVPGEPTRITEHGIAHEEWEWQDFDGVRGPLLKLAKEAFPEDKPIQDLHN